MFPANFVRFSTLFGTWRAYEPGLERGIPASSGHGRVAMNPVQMAAEWLAIACRREIVVRSLKVSAVVGTILALINHGDKLLGEGLEAGDLGRILLTFLVPYIVATWSAVQTTRAAVEPPR